LDLAEIWPRFVQALAENSSAQGSIHLGRVPKVAEREQALKTSGFWHGRRVLVTGNTGFKGMWLALWLEQLGADVTGLALPPATNPSLYTLAGGLRGRHSTADVRDAADVQRVLSEGRPQVVFHLAAQALVRASYQNPLGTFATNVMGTLNVLQAISAVPGVEAAVIVTTDKVYENSNLGHAFAESDRLGGKDPYSNSKACAELATQSFTDSFLNVEGAPAIATARAGNVVGGGDWSLDRLVPDVVRAHTAGAKVQLRYPAAIRPWQHVLEPLHGYLTLAQRLTENPRAPTTPRAVNFGPDPDSFLTVAEVVDTLVAALGGQSRPGSGWAQAPGTHLPEAAALTLSSELAQQTLGWRPRLTMPETIEWTAHWYAALAKGGDARALMLAQIFDYQARCGA
jgi:CDP-glucose 4,6-dehydratase